jgi:FtsP/CotA-like multicopper oxidase with cupredoxin domain
MMKQHGLLESAERWSRRHVLKLSLLQLGLIGSAALAYKQRGDLKTAFNALTPSLGGHGEHGAGGAAALPMQMVREFDYGTLKQENGRTVREFRLEAHKVPMDLGKGVTFEGWSFNNRIPGPTLRATEGDRVRVTFVNKTDNEHSIHFHGTHPANMDGVEEIRPGQSTVYEFDAEPYGLHLYHCHVGDVAKHIGRGLYGLFIIDPPQGRPPADEMVLIMAGYDTNGDRQNELYAINGMPHYFMKNPIEVKQNQLLRLYVLNMIEYDVAAGFHLHANMFQVYKTGRTLTPSEETDVITMGTAERHILECSFKYTGEFMFHPHQDAIAQRGCMGAFKVVA